MAAIAVIAPQMVSAGSNDVVARKEVVRKVADGFTFAEGPAVDRRGDVWFTDQPENRIWRLDTRRGVLREFTHESGRANGLYFDKHGNLVAAAEEEGEIRVIAPDGTSAVLARGFEGSEFNGPNDVWVNPHSGDIFFTDPYYPHEQWHHRGAEGTVDGENVYRIDAVTGDVVMVIDDFVKPNGIVGTPDGRTLYVSDIGAGKTWAYDIAADGELKNKRLFAPIGSDGMTVDNRGNVYLTGRGVRVYSPAGEYFAHISVPRGWTSNVVFGGWDRRTLYITAIDGLYAIEMRVRGTR